MDEWLLQQSWRVMVRPELGTVKEKLSMQEEVSGWRVVIQRRQVFLQTWKDEAIVMK